MGLRNIRYCDICKREDINSRVLHNGKGFRIKVERYGEYPFRGVGSFVEQDVCPACLKILIDKLEVV